MPELLGCLRRHSRGLASVALPRVYVAVASDSPRLRVRGVMLALPPGTIATGVTGLQLLGIDVGPPLPMTFATTHPRQVRRRDVKVMRLKQLPPHRDGVGSPEHCWLVAAATLNLLSLPPETLCCDGGARHSLGCSRLFRDLQAAAFAWPVRPCGWYGNAWTHRARPGCDCVWFSPGYRCRNAT
jgi:hypothetical protein